MQWHSLALACSAPHHDATTNPIPSRDPNFALSVRRHSPHSVAASAVLCVGLRGAAPEEKFTCGRLQRAVMTVVVTVCGGGGGGCRGGDRGGDDGVCGDSDGDDGVCRPSKRTTVISWEAETQIREDG